MVSKLFLDITGSEGENFVEITNGASKAMMHKHGATIVSWTVDGKELLYTSPIAIWDGTKPIRGGIPIVFPQFGTGPIMAGQHGFARNQCWNVEKKSEKSLKARLLHNIDTFEAWPHRFELIYDVELNSEQTISCRLTVKNLDDKKEPAFEFTALLHTYFNVGNIDSTKIIGLEGSKYLDKLNGMAEFYDHRREITISDEVDRNYLGTPSVLELICENGLVLWNPWVEKSKSMIDFPDKDYTKMLCFEPGNIGMPVILRPGSTWIASQTLTFITSNSNILTVDIDE